MPYRSITISDLSAKDIHRFNSRINKSRDCWLWMGWKNKTEYGMFDVWNPKTKKSYKNFAHRISFLIEHGSIDETKMICHHCDNPPCVNPKHLFQGTYTDNAADSIKKGRFVFAINGTINRSVTHCKFGHQLTSGKNQRICLTCCRDRARLKRGYKVKPLMYDFYRNRTHCSRGHEYTSENTYRRIRNGRPCRQCKQCNRDDKTRARLNDLTEAH